MQSEGDYSRFVVRLPPNFVVQHVTLWVYPYSTWLYFRNETISNEQPQMWKCYLFREYPQSYTHVVKAASEYYRLYLLILIREVRVFLSLKINYLFILV